MKCIVIVQLDVVMFIVNVGSNSSSSGGDRTDLMVVCSIPLVVYT